MLTPTRPWFAARVTRSWWESETLRGLAVTEPEVAARHHAPGQYVRVQRDVDERPYALASEPGAAELELLFKVDSPLTTSMVALEVGDTLSLSAPRGAGFPIDTHTGKDLILVAAGTGIAPLRAVVHVVLRRREAYGEVALFYGHREASHFAYTREWEGWKARGIEIVPVLSGEGGRVQDAVAARGITSGHDAVAYLAGMREMIADTKLALAALGVGDERVFLNY